MKDLAIIGAGPAGVTAAIYAKRAGLTLELLEKAAVGGQVSESGTIENYTAFAKISGMEFCNAMEAQLQQLEIVPRRAEVQGVAPAGGGFVISTDAGDLEAKTILLANGAVPRKLDVAGEAEFAGRGVSYCAHCDGAFFKGKTVAVIGGGNSAAESALYLSRLCKKVYVVYRGEKLRAEYYLTQQMQQANCIEFIWNSLPEAVLGSSGVEALRLRQVHTGELRELPVDGVFAAIGREPQNAPFASLVDLDEKGYILADEYCRASRPGVFAAGDTRHKSLRQIVTACADGALAVSSAMAHLA